MILGYLSLFKLKKEDEIKEILYFRCSIGNFYFLNNPFNIFNEEYRFFEIQNYYKVL